MDGFPARTQGARVFFTIHEDDYHMVFLDILLFYLVHHHKCDFLLLIKSLLILHWNHINKLEKIREKYPRAYMPWIGDEENRLRQLFEAGKIVNELCGIFQRQPGAIRSRLKKLGLVT